MSTFLPALAGTAALATDPVVGSPKISGNRMTVVSKRVGAEPAGGCLHTSSMSSDLLFSDS